MLFRSGKQQVEVAGYDDHELHIDEHLKRLLEEKDESLAVQIDEHIRQHKMMVAIENTKTSDKGGQDAGRNSN